MQNTVNIPMFLPQRVSLTSFSSPLAEVSEGKLIVSWRLMYWILSSNLSFLMTFSFSLTNFELVNEWRLDAHTFQDNTCDLFK